MGETLKKGTRVTGTDRNKLATDLRTRYDAGESIRALANATGHRLRELPFTRARIKAAIGV